MADRTELIAIEGSAEGFTAALAEAQKQATDVAARIDALNAQIAEKDRQRQEAEAQRAQARNDATLKRSLDAKIANLSKEEAAIKVSLDKTVAEHERAEARIVGVKKRAADERMQIDAREAETRQQHMDSFIGRAAQGVARSVQSPIPVPFLGGGLAGIGGALAGAAITVGIEKTIGDAIAAAKAIHDLQLVVGGTTDQVARLAAVGGAFGITADKMATSARLFSSAIADTPEKFEALGIATRNADGSLRENIDIINDTRRVFSEAKGGAETMRLATELFGRSVGDLIPWLRASEEKISQVTDALERAGLVMSHDAVDGALKFSASMDSMNRTMGGVVLQIGNNLIPWLAKAAEAAMVAGDMIGGLFSTKTWAGGDIPIVGGIGNFYKNIADIALGNKTDALKQINDSVNAAEKIRAEFLKLMASGALDAQNGVDVSGGLNSNLAASQKDAAQAAQDNIKDLREQSQARVDLMHDNLTAFEREKSAAIATIEAERKARDDAFAARDRQRSDDISGLRDELTSLQRLTNAEQERENLSHAEATLRREQSHEVFISKSDDEESYQRKVWEQSQRVTDAERKVADIRKKISEDTKRQQIEDRIKALERERELERRSLDDYKKSSDDKIAKLREEMTKEREKVTDAITQEERQTRAIIGELETRMSAHVAAGAFIRAQYPDIVQTIEQRIITSNDPRGEGPSPFNPTTADDVQRWFSQYLGRSASDDEIAGRLGQGRTQTEAGIRNLAEAAARAAAARRQTGGFGLGGGGGGDFLFDPGSFIHDFPHSIRLPEPTALIGASGRSYGVAAAGGAEDVSFGGVGRSASGGRTINITFNGLTWPEAMREVHRAIKQDQAAEAAEGAQYRR